MKLFWTIINGLFLSLILHAQDVQIRWATNPAYPPYDWSLEGKTYQGAAAKLIQRLSLPGVRFVAVVMPWRRAQEMARKGQIDMLVNIRETPERDQWLIFAQHATFPNPIVIFMRQKDKLPPSWSWNDLIPLQGGQAAGDSFGTPFDTFLKHNLQMQTAPTLVQNFRKLQLGRIDFYVTGLYLGESWLTSTHHQGDVAVLTPPVSQQAITLAFSQLSPHLNLLKAIDHQLEELGQSGVLKTLLEQSMVEAKSLNFSSLSEQ